MKFLVCGGRDFGLNPEEKHFVYLWLDILISFEKYDIIEVIHGAAKGVDSLVGNWCEDKNIACTEFPAEWNKYRKAAGYIRNKQMLDEGKPDWVIAFPGGKGTQMMINLAKKNKTKVKIIDYDNNKWFT